MLVTSTLLLTRQAISYLECSLVDADDHLIKAADFSLTSACPMNGLVTSRSALRPQAGQIAVGGNS
jgi:hypothetical protein